MKVVALISCMYEKDHEILERTNIQTDVVVVNQSDTEMVERFSFTNKIGKICNCTFISTLERGLSRSRNMAIQYAKDADICLLCDDDERLVDNYEDIIIDAFIHHLNVDVARFSFNREGKNGKLSDKILKMGIKEICRSSSVELAFRRQSILEAGIIFDVKMGSGSGNGGGEDTKFMFDCRRNNLKIYSFPSVIGVLLSSESRWFGGWNKQLLTDTGWGSRRIFGSLIGYIYVIYVLIRHRKDYMHYMSPIRAFYYLNKGFFQNR